MQISAVLFDKDGTLADFHAMWLPAYRAGARYVAAQAGEPGLAARLLAGAGYVAERDALAADSLLAVGSTGAIVAAWMREAGLSARVEVAEGLGRIFHEHASRAPRATADLGALLGRLRARGLALGVATMDGTAAARAGLRALGVEHLMDFIAGFDAGHGPKPGPGMALAFADAVGHAPARIAVVGDTAADLQMGRAAGAGACVGVLSGIGDRAGLEPWADVIIDDVGGLEAVLG